MKKLTPYINEALFSSWASLLVFVLVTIVSTYVGAEDRPVIPISGRTLKDFIPNGYEVAVEADADFRGDGTKGIAAILYESPESDKPRPLIILLQRPDKNFFLSAQTYRFDKSERDVCGAGNNYCVPSLHAKGRRLVVSLASGSASGYSIEESEY